MSADGESKAPLASFEAPVQLKLTALWIATMFVFVYVDILAFYKPGTVRDILEGRVWELDITQGWALGVLVLMTVPSLMVALSVLLPPRANRRTNLIVATLLGHCLSRQPDWRVVGVYLLRCRRRARAADRDRRNCLALASQRRD